jgi:transposase
MAVGLENLRKWLIKYRETHAGAEPELTMTERARLKKLECENQDLRAAHAQSASP